MKTFKTIVCVVALIAAFVTSKADLVINASGTAEIQTVTPDSAVKKSVPVTMSFNNKYIYAVISNAVANASFWASTNIAPKTLPADGYIAFNPTAIITNSLAGVFYVTNKSGFYYPLSGLDTNGEYYTWVELDSQDEVGYAGAGFRFGFDDQVIGGAPFLGVAAYNLNSTTTGPQTLTATAVLYIHGDPYSYDDGEYPDNFFFNYRGEGGPDDISGSNINAIEVHGILTATLPTVNGVANVSSLSIMGSGNLLYTPDLLAGDKVGVVKAATVKFIK